jgi:hypothetical protein
VKPETIAIATAAMLSVTRRQLFVILKMYMFNSLRQQPVQRAPA